MHQLTPQMEDRIVGFVKTAAEPQTPLKQNQIWDYIFYLKLTFHDRNVPIVSLPRHSFFTVLIALL